MRAATILRLSVVAQWVLIALTVALSFLLEEHLPEPLREWVKAEAERDPPLAMYGVIALLVSVLFCFFVGSVGLLFLQRWAAWLFTASAVLMLALTPVFGPIVEHGLPSAVDNASLVVTGLIIGLAFFGGALKPKNKSD